MTPTNEPRFTSKDDIESEKFLATAVFAVRVELAERLLAEREQETRRAEAYREVAIDAATHDGGINSHAICDCSTINIAQYVDAEVAKLLNDKGVGNNGRI